MSWWDRQLTSSPAVQQRLVDYEATLHARIRAELSTCYTLPRNAIDPAQWQPPRHGPRERLMAAVRRWIRL
ncbi:hypothetical protein [Nocardia sp. NPDC050793]|uniref:hypothetical protein n=1 Tax=Nocardia sp. NPDC050793 TaxID=3155159 RepID=UPI0033D6E9CF